MVLSTGMAFNASANDWPLIYQNARNNALLSRRAETWTNIASATNPSIAGQSVTFTATVALTFGGTSTPTGTVNFFDGTATIGSCTLASGSCTFATSALAVGTHSISATYLGNTGFAAAATAGAITQVVNPANFTVAVSGGQTVNAGQVASYTITITPNPVPYNFAVGSFGCSGLPTGTACTFNPASVTPGNSSATVNLSISTTSRTIALNTPLEHRPGMILATWLSIAIFGLVSWVVVRDNKKMRRIGMLCLSLLLACALLTSCGSGGNSSGSPSPQPNPNGTPAGSYSISVSVTGNGTTHNLNVPLTVN